MKDCRREFILAAFEYYKVSNSSITQDPDNQIDLAELFLKPAITCAILSPAGDKKYHIMSQLYKDDRSKSINPHYSILEKFFLGHIIKWADL